MKNFSVKLFGVIALIMVIGFSMAACEDATFIQYKGVDANGNIYTLIISAPGSRAAYSPRVDDDYELTIIPGNKKSVGTVESIDGGYELKPADAVEKFYAIIDSGVMIAIAGKIRFTDGTSSDEAVSFDTGGGTPILGSTIAKNVPVVYDPSITNKTAAKAVKNFLNKAEMGYDPPIGVKIQDFLVSAPTVEVVKEKVTIIIPKPSMLYDFSDVFPPDMLDPPDAKYFGTEATPMVFVNKEGPLDGADVYGLVCSQDNTHIAGLTYVDKDLTMRGTHVDTHPDAPAYFQIFNCELKEGWNYVFFTFTGPDKVGTNFRNLVFTSSTSLPSSYKWTVVDQNYFH